MSTETTALLTKAPLVTIHDSASVEDLAKLMVAEKADAVVVVDAESETLFGLVSDYDICFRVVAAGLDSKSTYLKDIATLDLVAIDERTMAYEALEIMIKRKFRHLLLASSIADGESDNDSGIVGVADIAEILFSKLSSLERLINEPSGVGCPDVAAILKKTKALPSILKISTVKDAAVFMKDRQEGGVLIIEGKTLLGLLTTKDIIHKVVSLGLDPEVTSVADVMTRNPCVGSPETTVLKSIHLMIDGNFTYLPILDKSRPIGLISVVSLVDTLLDYVALIRETLRKDRLKRQNDAVTDSYALSGATDGFKPTSKVKTHVPVTIDQITVQTIMEMPVFGPGYVCTSNLQPNEKDTGKPLAGMKASASNHDLKEPFLPKLAGAGSKAHLRQATWSHSQVSMSATSLLSKGNKMITENGSNVAKPNPKAIRTLEPLQNTPKPIGDSVFQSNGKNMNSTGEDYSKPDAYENINGEVTDIIKGRIEIKQDGPSSMNYGTSNLNGDESTNLTHGLQPFQDASAPDKQRKPQVKSLPPLPIKTNGDDAIPDTESDQTLSLKQAEEEAIIANKKLHFQGSSHARFTVVPRTLDPSGPDPIQMAQNLLAASTAQVMSTAGSQFMLTSAPKVTLSGAPQYVRTSQSPALHHNPPAHYVSGNEERSNASMKNVEAAQISDHGYSDTNENQKKTKQKTKQDDSTDEQQICVDVSSFGSKGTLKMESEKTHEASTPSTSSSNLARHQITSSRQTVPKPKTPNLPRQLTHQKISFVSHAETDLSFQKNEQAASPSHSELNSNMKKAVCLEESRENPIISEEVTLFQNPKDDLKPVDFLVSNTPIRPLSPEPPPEESKHEAKQNNDFPVVPAHKLPVLKSPRVIRIEKVQHYEKFRLTVKNVKRNEEPLPEVSNLEELEKEFITDFAFLENRENAKIRNQINERRRDINAEVIDIPPLSWDGLAGMIFNFYRYHKQMRMPVIDRDLTQEILGLMSHHPHVLPQELKLLLQKRTNTLNLKMTFKQLRRLSHASDDYPEPMYRQIARLFAPLVFDTPICEGKYVKGLWRDKGDPDSEVVTAKKKKKRVSLTPELMKVGFKRRTSQLEIIRPPPAVIEIPEDSPFYQRDNSIQEEEDKFERWMAGKATPATRSSAGPIEKPKTRKTAKIRWADLQNSLKILGARRFAGKLHRSEYIAKHAQDQSETENVLQGYDQVKKMPQGKPEWFLSTAFVAKEELGRMMFLEEDCQTPIAAALELMLQHLDKIFGI